MKGRKRREYKTDEPVFSCAAEPHNHDPVSLPWLFCNFSFSKLSWDKCKKKNWFSHRIFLYRDFLRYRYWLTLTTVFCSCQDITVLVSPIFRNCSIFWFSLDITALRCLLCWFIYSCRWNILSDWIKLWTCRSRTVKINVPKEE